MKTASTGLSNPERGPRSATGVAAIVAVELTKANRMAEVVEFKSCEIWLGGPRRPKDGKQDCDAFKISTDECQKSEVDVDYTAAHGFMMALRRRL